MMHDLMGRKCIEGEGRLIPLSSAWISRGRYPNPSQQDIANVGFDVININGAALVAYSHCPTGYVFGLNTRFMEFIVGEGKDFYIRGPFELQTQDGFTSQVILYAELVLQAPRLTFQASGLTA